MQAVMYLLGVWVAGTKAIKFLKNFPPGTKSDGSIEAVPLAG